MVLSRSTTSLLLLLSAAGALTAQVAGRLSGSAVDITGAAVPNARVQLYLPGGNSPVLTTQTTSEGNFDFASIRPDTYRLVVEAAGFAVYTQERVPVDPVRQTYLAPIQLQVQSASQSVDVSAAVATVEASSAEIASTVTQAQVLNLPVLDRQVNNLFYTQAGVNQNGRSDTVINGLRAQNTNVTLDGVNVQDNFIRINGIDYMPNKLTIGEVSEITVSSSNANPSLGGNANAISLSTPSGTNVLHGNGYWYNRNSRFSANDWFNNKDSVSRPFLNLNQFGGSVGGPIVKDKLLFFANYETYSLRQQTPVLNTILTPTARQGIFQYRDNGDGPVRQYNLLQNPGAGPALQIDPYIQSLLSHVPVTGNSTDVGDQLNTTGYQFNARANNRRDSIVGKADYNFSTRHVFSGTYRWNRDNVDRSDLQGETFYTAVPPVSNRNGANLFSASWRWSPGAAFTNELRGGGNLARAPFDVAGGLPNLLLSQTASVPAGWDLAFTSPVSPFLAEGRNTKTYNLQNNSNWVHGKHAVSFGFQTQQIRVATSAYAGIVPTYDLGYSNNSPYGFNTGDIPGTTSTDTNTANDLLATLAGLVVHGVQNYNITSRTSGYVAGAPQLQHLSFNDYAGYVSDSWKALRRLTLVLGVRYDYFPPVNEADALLLQPQLINNNPVQTLLSDATLNFSGNAVGRPMYRKDLNNFAPNIGFAWDVFGNGRSALRGGYSISYAQDDILEAVLSTANVNSGLVGTAAVNDVNARASAVPALPAPAFQVPITTQQNFINTAGNNVQGLIDPNLRTPYVQQWNLGIQQEWKSTIFEARYVGNHAVKLLRQIDFNQINIKNGGFLQDFINARQNGFAALAANKPFDPSYNPAIPGSVALPFFSSLPGGGALTNATVRNNIVTGQVGSLGQLYQSAQFFPTNDPNFSYFPNPYSLYSSELTNLTNSSYNGLQVEARRRTSSGMQFQASYVFSKALTDTSVERGLDALLDNSNPRVERARAPWDLTHSLKINHYLPLPTGAGHRLSYGPLNRVLGGWAASGFWTLQSGPPVSILSGSRGTLNRTARSGQNTVNTTYTLGQLQGITGLFMTGNGPYFVDPAHIGANGAGAAPDLSAPFAGQVFFNPGPGNIGSLQRRILSGPWFDNYNFAILKDTRITERHSIQFRADFYNLFNHPNFLANDQNINSLSFGKISSQLYSAEGVGPRVIQFGLFYKF